MKYSSSTVFILSSVSVLLSWVISGIAVHAAPASSNTPAGPGTDLALRSTVTGRTEISVLEPRGLFGKLFKNIFHAFVAIFIVIVAVAKVYLKLTGGYGGGGGGCRTCKRDYEYVSGLLIDAVDSGNDIKDQIKDLNPDDDTQIISGGVSDIGGQTEDLMSQMYHIKDYVTAPDQHQKVLDTIGDLSSLSSKLYDAGNSISYGGGYSYDYYGFKF